ncbi:MAG TPA: DMT family transporter [Spirochaetales bacterium]|nr:DMT family transporter [Spirochaetales bacterium]HRY53530.1 DMT family transporter [Spirochaetia bacterium]HRZ63896.1 DMT family transporter [Spirochaetia bacterium]
MNARSVYLAGLGWSSIFGLSFLVTKSALEAFSPLELLFLRFALATAALLALSLLGALRLRYRGKPRGILALTCLFQPLLYFLFETYGVKATASSTAGLILGAMPAAVAALSLPLLGERLSAPRAAGLALSVAGVGLVAFAGGAGGGADSPGGILLVVLALASAAFYNVLSRKASAWYSPAEITFAMMASGAAFFGALALAEDLLRPGPSLLARSSPAAWGAVAYLGILSSVLAFFLVNLTLSRLKAAQSALFGALVPLVSLAAGLLLRGEELGPAKLLGAAAILGGLWATNAPERGKAPLGEPIGELPR